MHTLSNSEDPDNMQQIEAFHQGLRCLLRQKEKIQRKKTYFWKSQPVTPHYIQWIIPNLFDQTRRKIPISIQRVNSLPTRCHLLITGFIQT